MGARKHSNPKMTKASANSVESVTLVFDEAMKSRIFLSFNLLICACYSSYDISRSLDVLCASINHALDILKPPKSSFSFSHLPFLP